MKKYQIEVPYSWSDPFEMGEDTVTIELFAKSSEQAREMAKNLIKDVRGVTEVHSTTILDEEHLGW